jgi:hypothetical protein
MHLTIQLNLDCQFDGFIFFIIENKLLFYFYLWPNKIAHLNLLNEKLNKKIRTQILLALISIHYAFDSKFQFCESRVYFDT